MKTKPITSFYIIATIGLFWNLMGAFNFYIATNNTESYRAQYTIEQLAVLDAAPSWLNIVFGISVLTGVLGCLLLLIRKKAAIPVFAISLVAIFIQMGYSAIMTNSVELFGIAMGIVMPLMVIAIAIFLFYYSIGAKQKHWIN